MDPYGASYQVGNLETCAVGVLAGKNKVHCGMHFARRLGSSWAQKFLV